MPYNPPSRHQTGNKNAVRTSGHRAFSDFMTHANQSSSSVMSRRKFYVGENDSYESCSDSDYDSHNRSTVNQDQTDNSSDNGSRVSNSLSPPKPTYTDWYAGSPNASMSSLIDKSSIFPLNRLLREKGHLMLKEDDTASKYRSDEENAAIKFTTSSPQSYSYALLSPNSMALRLKVLKRSLEILLERPGWLNANVREEESQNSIPLPASSLFTPPAAPALINRSGSRSSTLSTSSSSALSTTPRNSHDLYGSVPLHMTPSFRRRSSTANVMDNVLKLERLSSSRSNETRSAAGVGKNVSSALKTADSPPQSSVKTLGNVSVDKNMLEDLKEIIHFLEIGIHPELSEDQTSRMINLHNLSLTNAERIPKKTSLRIQLLHALATPFQEGNSSNNNAVAGIPMIKPVDSSWGLNNLQYSQQQVTRSSPQSQPSQGISMQFHSSSAGKTRSPKAVLTCGLESPWNILNSNDLACLMFGVSRQIMKSLRLMDLLAPRSRDLVFNRLQLQSEQPFAGEVIAIKRYNDKMAWTSVWAKRKENFIILIIEQIPCDSLDMLISKDLTSAENSKYKIETSKPYSPLFTDVNFSGKKLDYSLPTIDQLVSEEDDIPKTYKNMLPSQRDTELVNKVRYFTLRIKKNDSEAVEGAHLDDSDTDVNEEKDIIYAPCAVTSESLDPDDEEDSELRLNIHTLPYMAGSFVVSTNGYNIVSFNEAIAKNLFGHDDLKDNSVDCIIPGFSKLIDKALAENPGLLYEEGTVLPEHYWRRLVAQQDGRTEEEKELLFLRSTGLDAVHNDGNTIKVDVQLRLIDHNFFLLWVTYCRTILVQSPSLHPDKISDASLREITQKLEETKFKMDKEKKEQLRRDRSNETLHSEGDFSGSHLMNLNMQTVPSQIPLLSQMSDNLHSTGSSEAMSRSSTGETTTNSNEANPHSYETTRTTGSTLSSSSFEATNDTSSSSTTTSSKSDSNSRYRAFKLENALSQSTLMKRENDQIAGIRRHSKLFPRIVGKERRTKKMKDFRIIKNLGQGAYGKVVVAVRKADPLYKVVLKAIFKERILVDTWVRDKDLGTIPSEIQILNKINQDPHPNIMRIIDFFEDDKCYYLETMQHGDPPAIDLFDLIEVKTDMTEFECKYIYFQCCSAMAYLHHHGIVHRDIKDENIIVDQDFTVKLIDFGSAAYTKDGPFGVFVGTIDYAAPEVLNGKPYDGRAQDVWAMGVLLYTIIFKENPFCSVDEIVEGKLTFPNFPDVSQDCINLITSILVEDVNKRPTMKQILKSDWLKSMH